MANKKKQTGIIFIDKDRFDIFLPDKKSVISFEYQPAVIKDSEVLDREQLNSQIKIFIENNQLLASSLIIVLSKNLLFEKDFIKGQAPDQQQELETQQFLDNVPFESVGSKIVRMEKGFKVIAANADLYESVIGGFESAGFTVLALLPISLFGINIEALNQDSIKTILQKAESLKKYTLATEGGNFSAEEEEEQEKKKKKFYMIILVIFMFALAFGLIIFALFFRK